MTQGSASPPRPERLPRRRPDRTLLVGQRRRIRWSRRFRRGSWRIADSLPRSGASFWASSPARSRPRSRRRSASPTHASRHSGTTSPDSPFPAFRWYAVPARAALRSYSSRGRSFSCSRFSMPVAQALRDRVGDGGQAPRMRPSETVPCYGLRNTFRERHIPLTLATLTHSAARLVARSIFHLGPSSFDPSRRLDRLDTSSRSTHVPQQPSSRAAASRRRRGREPGARSAARPSARQDASQAFPLVAFPAATAILAARRERHRWSKIATRST